MRRYNLEGIHGSKADALRGVVGNPVVLASSCFALGLAAGLMLKGRGSQMYRGALNAFWHRDYARTVESGVPPSAGAERRARPLGSCTVMPPSTLPT